MKPSEITLKQQNPAKTTRNYLHQTTARLFTSHPPPRWFFAVDFEHDFIIRKKELGKKCKNLAMIMNAFSHNSERLL